MKKILLSAAFVIAALTSANAQQTISFESSEGFTLGDIHNQNGWTVTQVGDEIYSATQVISDDYSTDGDYSFRIANTPEAGGQSNGPVVGGFYSFDPVSFNSISFDVYIVDTNDGTDGADYMFRTADVNGAAAYTTLVYFSYQGAVMIQGGTEIVTLDMTWEPSTWYSIRIEVTDTDEIVYKINGNVVHQGTASTTQLGVIDNIRFVHDNYSVNGVAYLDNLKINVEESASVDNHLASTFSVYPNPAKDVLNISNNGAEINSLTIVDINGRTVKQVNSNVSQINISDLNAGVYFVNINSNEGSLTTKIVKQ